MSTPSYFVQITDRDRKRSGNAAVEFALVAPIMLAMMAGIMSYGGYFFVAHTVQQLANDAARAAIAGIDDTERAALVRETIAVSMRDQTLLRGEIGEVAITRADGLLRVEVQYDATSDLFMTFSTILPTPSPAIERSATIRLGGL